MELSCLQRNSKFQQPTSRKAPKSKLTHGRAVWEVGPWNLPGIWMLEFKGSYLCLSVFICGCALLDVLIQRTVLQGANALDDTLRIEPGTLRIGVGVLVCKELVHLLRTQLFIMARDNIVEIHKGHPLSFGGFGGPFAIIICRAHDFTIFPDFARHGRQDNWSSFPGFGIP